MNIGRHIYKIIFIFKIYVELFTIINKYNKIIFCLNGTKYLALQPYSMSSKTKIVDFVTEYVLCL